MSELVRMLPVLSGIYVWVGLWTAYYVDANSEAPKSWFKIIAGWPFIWLKKLFTTDISNPSRIVPVLVFACVLVITVAVGIQVVDHVESEKATVEDYCADTYGEDFENAYVESTRVLSWHCELENGTIVDVPDAVFD